MKRYRFDLNDTFNYAEWRDGSTSVKMYDEHNSAVDVITLGANPDLDRVRESIETKWFPVSRTWMSED